ncbi:hypothetical protein KY285_023404 [Solanum tuberosum]|nr:hypothetical protein KY285_023404 [Solanum tuberosum]
MPDGYASNISRCINLKQRKIFGMKSHDFHILMQHLLPNAIRKVLSDKGNSTKIMNDDLSASRRYWTVPSMILTSQYLPFISPNDALGIVLGPKHPGRVRGLLGLGVLPTMTFKQKSRRFKHVDVSSSSSSSPPPKW